MERLFSEGQLQSKNIQALKAEYGPSFGVGETSASVLPLRAVAGIFVGCVGFNM